VCAWSSRAAGMQQPSSDVEPERTQPLDAGRGEQRRRERTVEHICALGRAPPDARQIRVQQACGVSRALRIGHRGGPAGEVRDEGGERESQRVWVRSARRKRAEAMWALSAKRCAVANTAHEVSVH
jgi:hypothetical protein